MRTSHWTLLLLTFAIMLAQAGCHAPGKPTLGTEAKRPDQILDFPTLYASNCAGCHGVQGRQGAAISLNNPVYLATAGMENIQRVTSIGVAGTMMPPFARSAGGMLTDRQIAVLAQGMISSWGNSSTGQTLAYAGSSPGDATRGKASFTNFCSRCHGADGSGSTINGRQIGSLVDPAYLSLITDQGLRSIILSGMPAEGMPDWRSDGIGPDARAMTDGEVADTVAWLTAHRVAAPGQPYREHP
jgi:mono/diheme cytochrome c family protein